MPRLARAKHERIAFGFRYFPRIDAGHATALEVHLHHDAVRLGRRFLELALQDVDDKRHGGVIVIEQDDAILRRLLGLATDAFLDLPASSSAALVLIHSI